MQIQEMEEKIWQVHKKYATRHWLQWDARDYVLKFQEEVGEFIKEFLIQQGKARPEKMSAPEHMQQKVTDEFADVLWHIFLLAKVLHIDVESALADKRLRHLD